MQHDADVSSICADTNDAGDSMNVILAVLPLYVSQTRWSSPKRTTLLLERTISTTTPPNNLLQVPS